MPISSEVRQTGLIARVVDTSLNAWEDFAGIDINPFTTYLPVDVSTGPGDYDYWLYRGQASMALLGNGNIVRVRIGTPDDATDHDIWRQVITDPTNYTQWLAWTALGYGTNYAVAVERDDADGKGYRIYHSKISISGANTHGVVYIDNVLYTTYTNKPIMRIKPVYNKTNMIYFQALGSSGSDRTQTWYFDDNTRSGSQNQYLDCGQFIHYHHDMAVAWDPGTLGLTAFRFRARPPDGQERTVMASDILTVESASTVGVNQSGTYNTYGNVRHLKGPSQRAGYKRIDNLFVTQISDDEFDQDPYYLFYTEQHFDQFNNVLSNLKSPVFWSRSVGTPYYMSEAMPVGFSLWGFAGAVVTGGYVYIAGNGRVLRRPVDKANLDITNYVLNGRYELPRENGKGTGTLVCANPDNTLGAQLGLTAGSTTGALTERRIDFGIGLQRSTESVFAFKRDADWYIAALNPTRDEEGKQNIEIVIEDFWHRLEHPFKDTWSIPGRFDMSDWQPDGSNDTTMYTSPYDEWVAYSPSGADATTVPRLRLVASNSNTTDSIYKVYGGGTVILLTALPPTMNIQVTVNSWNPNGCGIITRWEDADNFLIMRFTTTGTYLESIKNGVKTLITQNTASAAKITSAGQQVMFDLAWWRARGYIDGLNVIDGINSSVYTSRAGFVGIFGADYIEVSSLSVTEKNASMTTKELIKMLLGYAGQHNVNFEDDEETLSAEQIMTLWGPQSDYDTPDKALRGLLEAGKLDIVFRQDD